jgi:hypothetical protein
MRAFLIVSFTLLAALPASADCPHGCIRVPNVGTSCTNTPTRLVPYPGYPNGFVCTETFSASYDIPQATLSFHSGSPFGGCNPRVEVTDDFTVTGLPAGTPVSYVAHFTMKINANCGFGPGNAFASVQAGAGAPATVFEDLQQCPTFSVTLEHQLAVSVDAVVGTPTHLQFAIEGVMGELFSETVTGTFTFDGLPNGTTIVSCGGFVEGPVPARNASWGSLKATYR